MHSFDFTDAECMVLLDSLIDSKEDIMVLGVNDTTAPLVESRVRLMNRISSKFARCDTDFNFKDWSENV